MIADIRVHGDQVVVAYNEHFHIKPLDAYHIIFQMIILALQIFVKLFFLSSKIVYRHYSPLRILAENHNWKFDPLNFWYSLI